MMWVIKGFGVGEIRVSAESQDDAIRIAYKYVECPCSMRFDGDTVYIHGYRGAVAVFPANGGSIESSAHNEFKVSGGSE